MSFAFISHSSANEGYVYGLETWLDLHGFRTWTDHNNIRTGDRWWKEIEKNIISDECNAVIVVVSPQSIQSEYVEKEIILAQSLNKPILPVSLEQTKWSLLNNLQYCFIENSEIPGENFLRDLERYVVRYKATQQEETQIKSLIASARNTTSTQQQEIIDQLQAFGVIAVSYLIDSLMSVDSYERFVSKKALTKMGAVALDFLIHSLNDGRPTVQQYVAEILGEILDDKAIEPLIGQLIKLETRVPAVTALGNYGERAFLPAIKALKHPHPDVVFAVCWVLRDIGDKRAIFYLDELKNHPDKNVRENALKTIEQLEAGE